MRNKLFLVSLLTICLFLSACGKKIEIVVPMDVLSEDNLYHYVNADLSFTVDFPAEFKYYQTQRKDRDDYVEIKYFVPTADKNYPQEIQSYGMPVMINIFTNEYWNNASDSERSEWVDLGEYGDRHYAVQFWKRAPEDWKSKWSDEMRNGIKNSFKFKEQLEK